MKSYLRALCILIAGSAALFICPGADWPTFRGNMGRTGFYPEPVGCPSGAPVWKISLKRPIISSPAIVDNILYIGARDSCIYAIDGATGKVRWKIKTGGWVDASPLVYDNRVIVGSRDSTIYVLDKNSGVILGRTSAGVQLSSPAVTAGGSVLSGLGVPGGGICAHGASASFAKEITKPQWSLALPQYTYSSPAIYGQAVVIGATDGKLYGINTSRRDTIWSLQTGGLIYLSTPAIDDTTVYFAPGDEDRSVYAVSLLTGKVFWRNEIASPIVEAAVLSKKSTVRLLSSADIVQLLRLSPTSRKETIRRLEGQGMMLPRVPEKNLPGKNSLRKCAASASRAFIPLGGMKTSSVAVGPDKVFVVQKDLGYVMTSDSIADFKQLFSIQAFDKHSGVQLWSSSECRKSPQLGYCSSPVVTKNMVFFGWGEGRIYGLSADSGKMIWEDSLKGHIISSPAIANGNLYVATMEGNLYCYNLSATNPGLDFQRSTYCYPNPARKGVSHIQVYVQREAALDMTVYNIVERPVFRETRRLSANEKYTYDWNLRNVANGVYFARIVVKYSDGGTDKKVLKIAVLK